MFELSHLRCFVAVAEELHFGRAAARLNLTQPPLSRQIQLLEHTLDVRLLDRTSRSVALTRAGHNFLPEARRLLRLAEGAALAARRTASGEEGSITLGFTAASGYEFLPRLIKTFRTEAPGIDLVLKEMVSADQLESSPPAGSMSGWCGRPSTGASWPRSAWCASRCCSPRRRTTRLAAAPEVSVADLDRQPIVTFSPYEARYFYDLLATIFANAGITPHYAQHISQVHSIIGAGEGRDQPRAGAARRAQSRLRRRGAAPDGARGTRPSSSFTRSGGRPMPIPPSRRCDATLQRLVSKSNRMTDVRGAAQAARRIGIGRSGTATSSTSTVTTSRRNSGQPAMTPQPCMTSAHSSYSVTMGCTVIASVRVCRS